MNTSKLYLIIIFYFLKNINLYAISLEDTLVATYNNNPRIIADRENLKIDDEAIVEALSGFLPQISSEIKRSKNFESVKLNDQNRNFLLLDERGYSSSGNIALRQSLFNGGGDVMQYRITKKLIEASRSSLSKSEQNVFLSAISAYINILLTQEKSNIYRNSVDVIRKYLNMVETKFTLGEVTKTDVAQAKSKLANSITEFTKIQSDLTNAKITYEIITGIKPENLQDIQQILLNHKNLDEVISLALKTNPSINMAKIYSDVEAKRILQKATVFLPNLNLTASISRNINPDYQYSEQLDRSILRKSKNKQVMLNLEIPIYQRGLEYQGLRKQKNLYQKRKNELQLENNKVINDVTKIWHDIEVADYLIKSSEENVNSATIALEGVTQEAELNQRTTIDVLETEQELMKAKLNAVEARYNKIMNSYNLKSQLGELTATALSLPTMIYDPKAHYDKIKFKIIGF